MWPARCAAPWTSSIYASTVLRMQVVASGVAVAVGDAVETERFEILTYASYARLNEERGAILEQIADERTVYGR